jgi:hypothetical protein
MAQVVMEYLDLVAEEQVHPVLLELLQRLEQAALLVAQVQAPGVMVVDMVQQVRQAEVRGEQAVQPVLLSLEILWLTTS